MKVNRGKKFEEQFKKDWIKTFPNSFILRLKDNTSGYFGNSQNPCDFICYTHRTLFMLEVKSHYGNTFPLTNLTQYENLLSFRHCEDIKIGVIIWFMDHDRILFVPLDTITQMKKDGCKSVNINKLDNYNIIDIPSTKKRVFLSSDYSCLVV